MHKFDVRKHKRLNSEERYRLMPPEPFVKEVEKEALAHLDDGEVATIADLGCGSGFFSLPLMKRLKNKNILLIAMDVNEEMLSIFDGNLKKESEENSLNVKSLKCEEYSVPLSDCSINILILANVFHEIEDKLTYLQEIKRVLMDGGSFFFWIGKKRI